MAASSEYEHYSFSKELGNIDKSVDEMEVQLNKVIDEIKKLHQMGKTLKENHVIHKNVWKQHNVEKLNTIFSKAQHLDIFLAENF